MKAAAWQNKHRGTRGAVERALLTVGFESKQSPFRSRDDT
ncbi:hypothetical protein [Escherichia coli]|nr:hypothetical protein [Escherichia coli]